MKREPYVTSANQTIAELNVLVYRAFKPKWIGGSWAYGKLYYFGDYHFAPWNTPELAPGWFLDGMTPVGPKFVLACLKERGVDVAKFEKFFEALEGRKIRQEARRVVLRKTAAAKLTKAERDACGLL